MQQNTPIHCFYRLAESPAAQPKQKIDSATKLACLENCIDILGVRSVIVFGDRVSGETRKMVESLGVQFVKVDEGSGGGNFRTALNSALELPDEELAYFLEDDFLHRPGAREALIDGLQMDAEYVTLYDHPDKYLSPGDGGNPLVRHGGEKTRLLCGRVCHWKITNSTVMTFACRIRHLRADQRTILKYCSGRYTDDYRMFRSLAWRGRRLICSIPGYATHCESRWLSPFYNWSALPARKGGPPTK
jgi:glycosyltransferase involved in cell wall biosynthesis